MKRLRVGLLLVGIAIAVLATGCGTTIRATTATMGTGRTLDADQQTVTARSSAYPFPLLISSVSYRKGLPKGWEVSGGYGIHGFLVEEAGDTDDSDDLAHGPEIFVTKELVDTGGVFHLAATAGAELDIVPRFTPTTHLGIDMGVYPLKPLAIFGGVRGVYILGGTPGMLVHAGVGFDAAIQAKLSFYATPVEIAAINSSGGTEIFWPVGAVLEAGFRF